MTKQLTLLTRMLRLQKLFSDRRKWVKGNYQDRKAHHTCYCLVGGLNKIRGKNPRIDYMLVEPDELTALGFSSQSGIYGWNDDEKRTIKDIRHRVAFGIKNARKMLKDPNYIPHDYQPEKTK